MRRYWLFSGYVAWRAYPHWHTAPERNHTGDFREEYECGRRDYFTRFEEIIHTEDELLDLLKARAQDNLYLGREQDTLRWAIGCTLGELSGRVFPLTQAEQQYLHSTSQVKSLTALHEA